MMDMLLVEEREYNEIEYEDLEISVLNRKHKCKARLSLGERFLPEINIIMGQNDYLLSNHESLDKAREAYKKYYKKLNKGSTVILLGDCAAYIENLY